MRVTAFINKHFFPNDNHPKNFPALDGLRGIAVILVLLSHSSIFGIKFHEYLDFSNVGKAGVFLFFILSAYLLDKQIALVFKNNKSNADYWYYYLSRRFLRIYPLFAFALLFYLICSHIGLPNVIRTFPNVLEHLFLVKGENVFWSIAVEFKYYLMSPIILFIIHKAFNWEFRKTMLTIALLIFVALFLNYFMVLTPLSTIKFFPVFLMGTVLSIVEVFYLEKADTEKASVSIEGLGWISSVLIILSFPAVSEGLFGINTNFYTANNFVGVSLCWTIVLIATKYGSGILRRIFEIKWLRFIGKISFSVYLFHIPILLSIKRNHWNFLDGFKIYAFIIFTILFASTTYLLIERPLSRIKISSKKSNPI